jgi:cytochrome c
VKSTARIALCATALLFVHSATAADPVRGEQIFGQCAACHAVGPDAKHKFGPALNGVFERDAASAEGYEYSAALKKAAVENPSWTEESLEAFLEAPLSYLPGTKMAYPGVADAIDRRDIIAYLSTIHTDGTSDVLPANPPAVTDAKPALQAPRPLAKDAAVPTHGVLHLGRKALAEEIAAWDIDIRPDGAGLPTGRGIASDGGVIYDAQCASCHGVFGEGEGRWPILAGGFDTLTDDRPEKTIGSYWPFLSTVFDYVKRAMPFGNARSLSDDDVYALTAYLLYLNDQVDEDFELNAENFASITMPNEQNFIADNRAEEPSYRLDEEPCMANCMAGEATVTQRARVLDVTPDTDEDSSATGID